MFLQNTPILSDAVPRVGTLGWYALPRWGKWDDGVSDPAFDRCGPGAKCGNRGQRPYLYRAAGVSRFLRAGRGEDLGESDRLAVAAFAFVGGFHEGE